MTTAQENRQIVEQLLQRLAHEFHIETERLAQVLAEEIGDIRLTFPGLATLARWQRDERIRVEFRGCNTEELAIRFGISCSQVRRIAGR